MKKNLCKAIGIFALTATLVFAFASCGGGQLHDVKIVMVMSGFTPVAERTPVTVFPPNEYCEGTIDWEEYDGTAWIHMTGMQFMVGVKYRAVLSLTAYDGYTFNGLKDLDITYTEAHVSTEDNTGNTLKVTVTFPPTVLNKTVTVGEQSGILTSGVTGMASFPVSTENVADGQYTATVANLPGGMSVSGTVDITDGSGTLTLEGTPTTAGMFTDLRLTINNATSGTFTLTIADAEAKFVSITSSQSGSLKEGVPGMVNFTVATTNINDDSYPASVANLPGGMTVSGNITITSGTGTLTLEGTPTTAGTFSNLTLTIDSTTSAAFTLIISEPDAKTVFVQSQVGTIYANVGGQATFYVITENITSGSAIRLNNINTVTGIELTTLATSSSATQITITATPTVPAGSHPLTLTIAGATSPQFSLTITPRTVSLNTTIQTITAGASTTYEIATAGITAGNYTPTVSYTTAGGASGGTSPANVTCSSSITVSGSVAVGIASITITTANTTMGGSYYFKVSIDGIQSSNVAELKVKKVTVGTQTAIKYVNNAGDVTFPVTVEGIAAGTYTSPTVANLPTTITVSGSVTIAANGTGTLTLTGTPTAVASYSNLTLTIDGTTSAAFTLTITARSLSFSDTTSKSVKAGNSAAYTITTAGFSGSYSGVSITWYTSSAGTTTTTAPTGAAISSTSLTVTNNAASITINTTTSTPEGGTSYFKLTIDGVQSSNVATLIVKKVTVAYNSGTIYATGSTSSATFNVTTVGIAAATYTPSVANLPNGVTVSGSVTIAANGTGTLTLQVTSADVDKPIAGTSNNLTLTIDDVTSAAFTLTISSGTSGTGTSADPFIVNSSDTLRKVGSGKNGWNMDKYYKQTANINLSGINWEPIGSYTKYFSGSYFGQSYTISNLTITRNGYYQGLFAAIGSASGTGAQDIRLTNVKIDCSSGGNYIGGIAGILRSGTIASCSVLTDGSTCYVKGSTTSGSGAQYVGGIVGQAEGGTLYFCKSNADVSGYAVVGGIAGGVTEFTVSDCYYEGGEVSSTGGKSGGIMGEISKGAPVQRCYVLNAMIRGPSDVGGIVGYMNTTSAWDVLQDCVTLANSVSTADNTCHRVVGRRVTTNARIVNCYAYSGLALNGGQSSDKTGVEGESVNVGTNSNQVNNQTWWSGTANFKYYSGGDDPGYYRVWTWFAGSGTGISTGNPHPKLFWEGQYAPFVTRW